MERGISEIFCDGADAKGEPVAVYRALRQLLCSACGTPIAVGGLFTRKGVPGFGPRILPRCGRCAPFEVKKAGAEAKPEGGEAQPEADETQSGAEGARPEPGPVGSESAQAGAKSAMIEKLLSPEPGADVEEGTERPRDMSEEAARRLGPALSRSRRGPR